MNEKTIQQSLAALIENNKAGKTKRDPNRKKKKEKAREESEIWEWKKEKEESEREKNNNKNKLKIQTFAVSVYLLSPPPSSDGVVCFYFFLSTGIFENPKHPSKNFKEKEENLPMK